MLASTVKFSKYNRHPTPTTTPSRSRQGPPTRRNQPTRALTPGTKQGAGACRPILQDPTTCQTPPHHPPHSPATPSEEDPHPPRGELPACTSERHQVGVK